MQADVLACAERRAAFEMRPMQRVWQITGQFKKSGILHRSALAQYAVGERRSQAASGLMNGSSPVIA